MVSQTPDSSLDDSEYDMLGESTILASEDEDHEDTLDSMVSVKGSSSDDVVSVTDTEYTNDSQETESIISQADTQDRPPPNSFCKDGEYEDGVSSIETTKGNIQQLTSAIEFEEPQVGFHTEQVAGIRTVRTFDQPQASEILRYLQIDSSPTQLAATVRQTMTKNGLIIDEPFRVLYIGNALAKDDIMTKIGSALAVSGNGESIPSSFRGRSTKFSVIPISSFGDSATPEVELIDSLGPELIIDDCTAARATKIQGEPDTLVITLNGHLTCQSRCIGSGFELASTVAWKLPNVAVFFRSDSDDLVTRQTRHFARSFLIRHLVPSIVISESPLYESKDEKFALDHNSVHMCLESRGSSPMGNRVLRRLPIDLITFLNINPAQMNRNLACLTGLHSGGNLGSSRRDCRYLTRNDHRNTSDIEKLTCSSEDPVPEELPRMKRVENFTSICLGLFLASLFIASIVGVVYLKLTHPAWKAADTAVELVRDEVVWPPSSVSTKRLLAPLTSKTIHTQPTTGVSNIPTIPKDLSLSNPKVELATLYMGSSIGALNRSDRFEMHIIGDSHMILRPPQRFIALRKAPQLFVKVTRKHNPVNVQLSKLFDGVYALKFDREEAYGVLNVTIWTKLKPIVEQTFEMDFGTPWLKIAGWRKAARNLSSQLRSDLRVAQTGLQATFNQMSTDLHEVLGHAAKGAKTIRDEAIRFENSSLQSTFQIKALVAARFTHLSHGLSKQSANITEQLSQQVRKVSRELAIRVTDLSVSISTQVSKIHQTTKGVDVSRLLGSIPQVKNNQSVKKAQRQALTIWRKAPFIAKRPKGKGSRQLRFKSRNKVWKAYKKACKKCNR